MPLFTAIYNDIM